MTKLLLLACLLVTASLGFGPALAQSIGSETETIDQDVLRCLQMRRGEPRVAVGLADRILATAALSDENRIKALICKGLAVALMGDQAQAGAVTAEIRRLMARNPELPVEFQLRAWSNLGAILHASGQMHQAVEAYTRANEVSRQASPDDARVAQRVTLTNIGLIHADYLDSPAIADRYYREALALPAGPAQDNTVLLYNHAVNLISLGRLEEARDGLVQLEAQAAPLLRMRARAERARLLIDTGALAEARALLDQSLAVQRELSDVTGQSNTLAILADWHLASGQPAEALRAAEQAWALVQGGSSQREKVQALQARLDATAALGRTSEVLALSRELQQMQIGALKAQRLELLADLQSRTRNAGSERQLLRLRHEAEVQALQLANSRLVRNAVLGLLVLVVLAAVAMVRMQRRRNRLLRAVSATDPLTGLRNRQSCTEALNALRKRKPTMPGLRHVVFLIDIDHFKRINDSYGHHAGDNVLAQVSRRLEAACKPGDVVARWGGEEFLVACSDLSQEKACGVAARLIAALDCNLEVLPDQPEHLTVSLGFAPFPFFRNIESGPACRWEYALRMADRALYAAKDRRDAWTGFWGAKLDPVSVEDDVLENPDQGVRDGMIDVVASYPLAPSRTPQSAQPSA